MRQWSMDQKGSEFFFLLGGAGEVGRGDYFFVFYVPNVFSSSFQNVPQIPNVFHKMFPIPAHKCPICFAQKLSSFQLYR